MPANLIIWCPSNTVEFFWEITLYFLRLIYFSIKKKCFLLGLFLLISHASPTPFSFCASLEVLCWQCPPEGSTATRHAAMVCWLSFQLAGVRGTCENKARYYCRQKPPVTKHCREFKYTILEILRVPVTGLHGKAWYTQSLVIKTNTCGWGWAKC